ncbi:MAG: arginine--tRNA ligase [Candidatus Firestonebacteria bacterium]
MTEKNGLTIFEIKNLLAKFVEDSLLKAKENKEIEFNVGILPKILFEQPKDKKFGDLATNFAIDFARKTKIASRKIAEIVIVFLKESNIKIISKIEVAGPGFLNFFLNYTELTKVLLDIENTHENYGCLDYFAGKSINVEFVSANPVGPLNIVNARAAAVGDCLCRLLTKAGYIQVVREYYINDAGNQIKIFGESVASRYKQALGVDVVFPENGYQGEYVKDIANWIKETYNDKYLSFSQEEQASILGKLASLRIIEEQKSELKNFGVEFDVWFSEKTLHTVNKVKDTLDLLKTKECVYEKDNAIWLKTTQFGDDKDRVLVKENGDWTYFLVDIAYHIDKFKRGFNTLLDIWGPDHHGHIIRMKSAMSSLGIDPSSLVVLIAQQVNLIHEGEVLAMSKRAGKFITMKELVDEVGADVVKYFFIMKSLDAHFDFDIELAKKHSDENPVYYIQYAFARICSILRNSKESVVADLSAKNISEVNLVLLKEEEEHELIFKLASFPELILNSAIFYAPHWLPKYLEELASIFHRFYTECKVLSDDKDLTLARLLLVSSTKTVIKNGLDLMGISTPEKM